MKTISYDKNDDSAIVRSRTQTMEFSLVLLPKIIFYWIKSQFRSNIIQLYEEYCLRNYSS
jgi:hypothetical protein